MIISTKPHLYVILAVLVCYISACGKDPGAIDEQKKTFRQYATHQLRVHGGLLYASTDSGLYRKPVDPENTNWESLGLGNATIRTFLVFSDNEFLVSAAYDNSERNTIAKTNDGGEAWFRFQNGFGGDDPITPLTLDLNPINKNILYGRGFFNVAKSVNRGKSWDSIYLSWDHIGSALFVKVDKNNTEIIWAGGSKAIFSAHLIKSTDAGQSWAEVPPTGTEANVNDVAIHPSDSDIVLAGLLGAVPSANVIYKTTDGGEDWTKVFEGAGILTLARSLRSATTVYASGRNEAGTPFFLQSDDFGDSWQEVEILGAPDRLRVNDMVAVEAGGREVLYFGTNKGVYSYTLGE